MTTTPLKIIFSPGNLLYAYDPTWTCHSLPILIGAKSSAVDTLKDKEERPFYLDRQEIGRIKRSVRVKRVN